MDNPRQKIVDVARRYTAVREVTKNRAPELPKFWSATTYPDGADNREPWCAAFTSFCVQEADKESEDIKLRTPPKFPSVAEWLEWAKNPANGCALFHSSSDEYKPEAGDIVIYLPQFSHIGIVTGSREGVVRTIEGNTNAAGSREGDGVYEKERTIDSRWTFVRIPAIGHEV